MLPSKVHDTSQLELDHIQRLKLLDHSKFSLFLSTRQRKHHDQHSPWCMYRPRTSAPHSLGPLNFGFDFPSLMTSAPVTLGPPIKLTPSESV